MRRAAPSGRALTQPDSSAGWKRKEFAMTRYYFHTKDGADLLTWKMQHRLADVV
jgi:hypothetical protein